MKTSSSYSVAKKKGVKYKSGELVSLKDYGDYIKVNQEVYTTFKVNNQNSDS